MLADRQFDTNGQLYFPDSDNPANLNGPPGNPDKHPFWIPEFFGDVITVNGKSWPTMSVEPRRYRFRFVNAQQRALLHHAAVQPAGRRHAHQRRRPARRSGRSARTAASSTTRSSSPIRPTATTQCAGDADRQQHATSGPGANCLFLAPAERADVIIDFAGQAGKTFTLKNFAVIPFPSGGPVGFGAPDATSDGLVMQFRVNLPLQGTDTIVQPGRARTRRCARRRSSTSSRSRPTSSRQLILVEEEGDTANPDGPGSPVGDGDPVESLINNTKWNGNREGTTTVVPGSTLERPRRVGDGDAARGRDRAVGGRQPDRRRAPDPHPPDPVPGDLAPAVRRRHLPDRLDGGVPGRHVQRLHLPARRLHPGLRAAAQLHDAATRRARWAAT